MSAVRALLAALCAFGALAALAAPLASDDLAALNDEFGDARTLARWTRHDVAEGWPSQWRTLDVNTTSPGHLYLEPFTSAWWAGFRAPLLYKTVTGDFVVTARVQATGLQGGVPQRAWSLMGLMARAPLPDPSPERWDPSRENWVFLTVGTANLPGVPQIEDKTTEGGESRLRVLAARPGWVDLRLARVGRAIVLLRRYEGEGWAVHQRFDRPDLPAALQVGVNAYTDWPTLERRVGSGELDARTYNARVYRDGRPDLAGRVDWVRFRRPALPPDLRGVNLASPAVSDARLLAAFGGEP